MKILLLNRMLTSVPSRSGASPESFRGSAPPCRAEAGRRLVLGRGQREHREGGGKLDHAETFDAGCARERAHSRAFTLLEVMIAMFIFFMCIFAILDVVGTNLRAARRLQQPPVDIGLLIADLCQTNKLVEGSDSGDFGELFPGYVWESETSEVGTNGLFKVDFRVTRKGGDAGYESQMSVLLWRPDSPSKGTGLLPH